MFTGIVQGIATVAARQERPGLVSCALDLPRGLGAGLEIGASVAVDGCCLTVTSVEGDRAQFDVMAQTLALTTLGALREGAPVNVERSAKTGVEIGGHVLSGHVDARVTIASIRRPENNHVIRFAVPAPWMNYLFAKGFVALNGASLTIADCARERDGSGWIEVWLIPETLRMTTFGDKAEGDAVHLEIDRQTQVIVETVERVLAQRLASA
jgi:riboflavin synthase